MPITFEGVGSHWDDSATIRKDLAERDEKIILSFSRGKDSLGAWLGMLDSGIKPENIIPVYYYRIPGMKFTMESLAYFEDVFEKHVIRLPHPSLYRMLNDCIYQPPTRTGIIDAAAMPNVTYQDLEAELRKDQGLAPDTLIATGVRAADSIARRTMLKKTGPLTLSKHRLAVVWDWTQGETYGRIAEAGIKLPPDYEWFARINPKSGKPVKNSGRTFDGIAAQFLGPLKKYAPDDYATILEWFPLADMDLIRHGLK